MRSTLHHIDFTSSEKIDTKLFAGTIIVILDLFGFRKLQETVEKSCNCTILEALKMANCKGQNFREVPKDCGSDIQVPIFSIVFVD